MQHRTVLRSLAIWGALALFFTLGGIATSQAMPSFNAEDFQQKALEVLAKHGDASGAALAITYKNQVIYTGGVGRLNMEEGSPEVSSQTLFRVGSVSKMLTAVAIHRLIQAGAFGLDTPVVHLLPWFSLKQFGGSVEAIKVRHLLNHSSGISREIGCIFADEVGRWIPNLPLRDCVAGQEVIFSPGHTLKYSNLGYVLLGQIVANHSKLAVSSGFEARFFEVMQREVFRPLGMSNARYALSAGELENLATPYGPASDFSHKAEWPKAATTYESAPAWGLAVDAASISKMLLLIQRIIEEEGDSFLGKETVGKILRPMMTGNGGSYGLGFMDVAKNHVSHVGHTGHMAGYTSSVLVNSDSGVGVAVFTNSVLRATANELSVLAFAEMNRALGRKVNTPPNASENGATLSRTPSDEDPRVPNDLEGSYFSWPREVQVYLDGTKVYLRQDGISQYVGDLLNNPSLEFRQSLSGSYTAHLGEPLKFERGSNGEYSLVVSKSYRYLKDVR